MRKKQEKDIISQTGTEMTEAEAVMAEEPAAAGGEEAVSYTGPENGPGDLVGPDEAGSEESIPQTGSENETELSGDPAEVSAAEAPPQTGSENESELSGEESEVRAKESPSQTGSEKETKLPREESGVRTKESIPYTGSEKEAKLPEEASEAEVKESIPQTGSEKEAELSGDPAEVSAAEAPPQTGSENESELSGEVSEVRTKESIPQTGSENEAPSAKIRDEGAPGPVSGTGRRRQAQSRSDRETGPDRNIRPGITASILSIDDHLTVETDADRSRNDLLDLLESQKTGRILTGTIQGVERQSDTPGHSLAVLYHGDYKIIIPADEAVEPPREDSGRRSPDDMLHYMITKRLGAEVDYIVKGIDQGTGLAAASRLEAMRARRKEYYFGTDREGNYILYSGICAEARVVSVIRAGIFVDLFGLELYIPLRELSYQRWMDAAAHFQPGQRILVKVLEVDRRDRNNVRASVSVKQAQENPYEKALRRYSVGNRYVGTVSVVDTTGVFVALDGGIDCLCSYPKRGRPPRGSRVTVRILGIDHVSNRIWGAITHIAVPR